MSVFTQCTAYPGGTLIIRGGSTTSTGIELVGSGTANAPFLITENNTVLARTKGNAFIYQCQP